MPREHLKFVQVDRIYQNNMNYFFENPLIWESIENDRLIKEFDNCNYILDSI